MDRGIIIIISFLLSAAIQTAYSLDWNGEYNGHQYYVTTNQYSKRNWFDARATCMEEGGDLATLETAEEENFIKTLKSNYVGNLWIGLNNLNKKSEWEWADGGTSSLKSWNTNEPKENELCGCRSTKNSRFWYSDNCNINKGYLCKRKMGVVTPKTTIATPTVGGYCPVGWTDSGGRDKCYKVFTFLDKQENTWANAQAECKKLNFREADLACANSQVEVSTLMVLSGTRPDAERVWIGLSRPNRVQEWIWVDNTIVRVTNFHNGHHDSDYGCGFTSKSLIPEGSWDSDMSCRGREKSYICQILKDRNNIIPTAAPTAPNVCSDGYVPFGKGCYRLITETKTFQDAQSTCSKDGAHMVDMHSASENAAVQILLSKEKIIGRAWIGLMFDQDEFVYKWENGWYFNFAFWGAGQPKLNDGGGCVAIESYDGYWFDTTCSQRLPTVCKKTSEPPITEPPKTEGRCPGREWFSIGNQCYWGNCGSCSRTWLDQQASCRLLHQSSGLASIHDPVTNEELKKRLRKKIGFRDAWLGLHLSKVTNRWMWSDGTELDYTNWGPNEPPEFPNSAKGCVYMGILSPTAGKWFTSSCGTIRGRLCQVEKSSIPTLSPAPGDCPSDKWTKHGAVCYLFRPDEFKTWEQAKSQCIREGGSSSNLARLDDYDSNDFVHYKMITLSHLPSSGQNYWIGLRKFKDEDVFRWDNNGQILDFTHWGNDQPKADVGNVGGKCVEVNFENSLWENKLCGDYAGYVCGLDISGKSGAGTIRFHGVIVLVVLVVLAQII